MLERGRRMAAAAGGEGTQEEERITEQLKDLEEAWARLQEEMAKRRERLNGSDSAQQYYNDADEAEAWIGEQELYMIADEKAKVRNGNEPRETYYLHPHNHQVPGATSDSEYVSPPSFQDEQSAMVLLKRHLILKQAVDDYADCVQKLAHRAQKMFAEEHPDGWVA